MRIQLRDVGQAKKLAKRLKAISENSSSSGIGKLPLARCHELVARMLGYRDWHELQRASDASRQASPDDRDVEHADLIRRRLYQTDRLEEAGFHRHTAAALVDSLLPSGNPERERDAIQARPEKPVDDVSGLAAEFMDLYLNNRAYRVALGDILIDRGLEQTTDGLFEAHLILAERMRLGFDPRRVRDPRRDGDSARAQTRKQGRGYLGLVMPARDFYQGYMIHDMGAETRMRVIEKHRSGLEMLGQRDDDRALAGALQASICHVVEKEPQSEAKLAAFMDALVVHMDENYLVVIGHAESGGWRTELEALRADDVHDARRLFEGHPQVRKIQARLRERYGLTDGRATPS